MARKNDAWGIEVGANAIKAIRLVRKGDELTVADYAVVPFKKILTTPDIDVDEQIQLGLDQFQSTHSDVPKSTIVISVPGHAAFARFAKLPPVEPKKIPDIVKFEAVQQIPFPIEQVEWDYQTFSKPDSPDVEVGIFAMTTPKVESHLDNYREVGLTPDGMTLSPVAVYNAISYDQQLDDESNGVVMLDIGTTSTDVIIHEAGKLWLRTLPIGGNNFTEALVRAFKLSQSKAEKLKREAGTSKYARQIFTAMRPVFSDFVQELQRSLAYYQSLNRDAKLDKLIGLGSTFRLPGLQKFLKQQLQIDVVRPDGFNRINVEGKRASDFADHTLNLATAYGLAIQGLGLEPVTANILPVSQIRSRLWRSKQRWFAASAAIMVLPVILMWGSLLTMRSSFNAESTKTKKLERRVTSVANKYKNELRNIQQEQDPREDIENLNRILDYRDVWPKLVEDIAEAARALGPQEITLTTQYDQIAQIPRKERRRIYIDSIEVEYLFSAPATAETYEDIFTPSAPEETELDSAAAMSGGTSTLRGGRLSPRMRPGAAAAGFPGVGGAGMLMDGAMMANQTPTIIPSFRVTIKGTTPKQQPAKFISEHFIKWLQKNNDQPDRPYRVVVSTKTREVITRLQKVGEVPGGRYGGPRRTGSRPGFGHPRRPERLRIRSNTNFPQPMGGIERRAIPDPIAAGMDSFLHGKVSDLIPLRPLAKELSANDWYFEIVWTIGLVEPERARQAESGTRIEEKSVEPAGPASPASLATPDRETE